MGTNTVENYADLLLRHNFCEYRKGVVNIPNSSNVEHMRHYLNASADEYTKRAKFCIAKGLSAQTALKFNNIVHDSQIAQIGADSFRKDRGFSVGISSALFKHTSLDEKNYYEELFYKYVDHCTSKPLTPSEQQLEESVQFIKGIKNIVESTEKELNKDLQQSKTLSTRLIDPVAKAYNSIKTFASKGFNRAEDACVDAAKKVYGACNDGAKEAYGQCRDFAKSSYKIASAVTNTVIDFIFGRKKNTHIVTAVKHPVYKKTWVQRVEESRQLPHTFVEKINNQR